MKTDYNRDGRRDVFVLRWKRPSLLYRNEGDGKFTEISASVNLIGLGSNSSSAVFTDYNRDEFPDLLITQNATYERVLQCMVQPNIRLKEGVPRLFRNEAGNGFREVTREVGLDHAYGTMDSAVVDWNGDGWQDVVLVNGGGEAWRLESSVVLINQAGNQFHELAIPSRRTIQCACRNHRQAVANDTTFHDRLRSQICADELTVCTSG